MARKIKPKASCFSASGDCVNHGACNLHGTCMYAPEKVVPDGGRAPAQGPAPKTGFRSPFQVVPVAYEDAARMFTVEPDSALWNGDRHAITAAGLFVRLRPPPGADPTAVESLKQSFLKAGALAVRVVPAAKAEVLPPLADKKAPAPHRTIREVVTAMVAESNTQDREALAALCESAISKEGL